MPARRKTGLAGIKARKSASTRRGAPTARSRAEAPSTKEVAKAASKTQRNPNPGSQKTKRGQTKTSKVKRNTGSPKTQRGQTTTRRTGRSPGTGRYMVPGQAKKNNLPLILGIAGGGLLVFILIIAAAVGGGSSGNGNQNNSQSSNPSSPADVSGLERSGRQKCEEGLAIVQSSRSKFQRTLSTGEQRELKASLKRALTKLKSGLADFEKAQQLSDKGYDVQQYISAKKTADMKIHELAD